MNWSNSGHYSSSNTTTCGSGREGVSSSRGGGVKDEERSRGKDEPCGKADNQRRENLDRCFNLTFSERRETSIKVWCMVDMGGDGKENMSIRDCS